MAIWPFNRRPKDETEANVPEEVKEYYETERRERMGVAWLIAFGSLVATILIVLGLFFGGRWVYRKVAHKTTNKPTTTQTASNTKSQTEQQKAANNKSNPNPSSGSSQPGQAGTSSPSASGNTSQPSPSGQSAPSSSSSAPASSNQHLSQTGPGSSLLVSVAVTIVAGYFLALLRFRTKNSN